MSTISFFFLEFDPIDGPVITNQMGGSHSEQVLTSIRFNSFPESIRKLTNEPHVYSFRAAEHYCYCYYHSVEDKTRQRGFHQFSFVILTENKFYPVWYRLLHSISNLSTFDFEQKFQLLIDFGTKINNNFGVSSYFELPLFNGSTPIATAPKNEDLIKFESDSSNSDSKYLSNGFFIGDSLSESLFLDELTQSGHYNDLFRVWENVILEKPLLVCGATPEIASRAVFAIASLAFSSACVPNVIPYISVTDPNFANAVRTSSIIGVSNPIATAIHMNVDTFYAGFGKEGNGFRETKAKENKVSLRVEEIRASFVASNSTLLSAIDSTIKELHASNPFAPMLGKIDLTILEKYINLSGLHLFSNASLFSSDLVHTQLFKLRLRSFLETDLAVKRISEFDPSPLGTTEIRIVCTQIAKVLRKKHSCVQMQKALRTQLRDLFSSVTSSSL